MNTTRTIFAAVLGFSFLSTGIPAEAGPAQGFPFGQAVKATPATRTITITLKDNVYEPETAAVNPGETIRFVVVNKGDFLHEFALGQPNDHAKHQEMMKTMMDHGMITPTSVNRGAMKMDMGPGGHAHGPESASVLVEPGQRAELTWKFTKPMTLEFACTIPGHYESGMVGTIDFNAE